MNFPRHTAYRDSGVGWIGRVPSSWSVMPLRRAVSLVTDRAAGRSSPIALENVEGWTGKFIETRSVYDGNGTAFATGDILFGKLRPYLAKVWLATQPGEAVGDFHVLRNSEFSIGPFIQNLLLCREVISQISGATQGAKMPRSGWDFMGSILVPMPSTCEQQRIVDFISRQTRKIDQLVAEYETLTSILFQKKQAVISHAVTSGVHPVPVGRSSGASWMTELPLHWPVVPIRALFRFVKRPGACEGEVLSVYRDYGVIKKNSRSDNFNKTPDDLSTYQAVRIGDLVVNKMKAWQGSLGISIYDGIISPDYAVFEPTSKQSSSYMNWLLRCNLFPGIYRSISNGIRPNQWRLEPDRFKELKIPLPPAEEQIEISSHLDELVLRYDELREETHGAIALLRERRAALISAAITGKIDVGGLVETALDTQAEAA